MSDAATPAKTGVPWPGGLGVIPWSDEVRELAYQMWAYVCQRSPTRTIEQLCKQGHNVAERTLYYWRDTDHWIERAAREHAAIAPAIRAEVFSELMFASLDAARHIRRVNAEQEPPDPKRLAYDLAAIDRIGLAPSRDPSLAVSAPAQSEQTVDIASLSDDELLALEASILSATRDR